VLDFRIAYQINAVAKISLLAKNMLNTSLFGQWNNEDEEILLNSRIHWIPKIGSDFYFVINQVIETGNNTLKLAQTTIVAKLILRFAL